MAVFLPDRSMSERAYRDAARGSERPPMSCRRVIPAPSSQDTCSVDTTRTAGVYPGGVTRINATFDIPGLFVWHCHILSHEDNEMMRPFKVVP
jgi:hypothetical protein